MSEKPSISKINQDYWEKAASTYDAEPWKKEVARKLTLEIASRAKWIGLPKQEQTDRPLRVLDYACGPGMGSFALKPFVSSTRGMDISAAMAAEYNRRARAQGFSEEEMFAMQSNLLNRDESASNPVTKGEEWYNFDVAIVCLGFHHLEDPELAVEQLVQRLRPGTGSLVVLDFLDAHEGMGFNEVIEDMKKESGSSGDQGHEHGHGHSHNHKRSHEHGHQHNHGQDGGDGTNGKSDPVAQTVALHGFSIDRIQEIYRKAGCKDVEVALVDDPIQFEGQFGGRKIKAFISRGYRAPSSI